MNILKIINSVFTSNTFILSDDHEKVFWLIDIGDISPVLENIPPDGIIKGLFLTHTHYDHIYGINKLVSHFPECIVYTSEYGKEGLFSDKFNFSRYHDDPVIFSGSHIQILKEGDDVELFSEIKLNILETPGHDRSCLTYYTEQAIFTGDSFIPGLKVVTSFPYSNKMDSDMSVQKILLRAEGRDLYPGHGEIFQNFFLSPM